MTRTLNEPPAGFDLENYRPFETMTTFEWSGAVFRRLSLALHMEHGGLPESFTGRFNVLKLVRELIREPARVRAPSPPPPGQRPRPKKKGPRQTRFWSAVHSMTLAEARYVTEFIEENKLQVETTAESFEDGMSRHFDDVRYQHRRPIDQAIAGHLREHLVVDIEKPTDVLEREFRQWLNEVKRVRGLKADGDGIRIQRWVADRLLPFFDLTAFSWSEGKRYTDARMFELLFPDDLDAEFPARKVKQTIRPNARALVSGRTFDRLSAAAIRDGSCWQTPA